MQTNIFVQLIFLLVFSGNFLPLFARYKWKEPFYEKLEREKHERSLKREEEYQPRHEETKYVTKYDSPRFEENRFKKPFEPDYDYEDYQVGKYEGYPGPGDHFLNYDPDFEEYYSMRGHDKRPGDFYVKGSVPLEESRESSYCSETLQNYIENCFGAFNKLHHLRRDPIANYYYDIKTHAEREIEQELLSQKFMEILYKMVMLKLADERSYDRYGYHQQTRIPAIFLPPKPFYETPDYVSPYYTNQQYKTKKKDMLKVHYSKEALNYDRSNPHNMATPVKIELVSVDNNSHPDDFKSRKQAKKAQMKENKEERKRARLYKKLMSKDQRFRKLEFHQKRSLVDGNENSAELEDTDLETAGKPIIDDVSYRNSH